MTYSVFLAYLNFFSSYITKPQAFCGRKCYILALLYRKALPFLLKKVFIVFFFAYSSTKMYGVSSHQKSVSTQCSSLVCSDYCPYNFIQFSITTILMSTYNICFY